MVMSVHLFAYFIFEITTIRGCQGNLILVRTGQYNPNYTLIQNIKNGILSKKLVHNKKE